MQTQPPTPAPNPDRLWLFGSVAVLLALALAVVTWWLTRPDDLELTGEVPPTTSAAVATTDGPDDPDDESSPDVEEAVPPAPTTTRDPEAPPPTLDPDDPRTQQIDEIIEFVEAERGLDFLTKPLVQLLGDAEFIGEYNALVEEEIAEDPDDYVASERIYWALGFLDRDVTRRELDSAFGDAGIVGFYNTETNELFVRTNGGELTPYVKTVVAHELVHALDDQHFELFRPEYDDVSDERGFGLAAMAEGNANRIEAAYTASLSSEEQQDATRESLSAGGDVDFSIFRPSFFELAFAPYDYGEPFVEELFDREGNEGLAEAFMEPPRTAEVVMHPERYFAGEGFAEVNPPESPGVVIDEGVFGELVLRAMMVEVLSPGDAIAAADGWSGDWYVLWYEDTRACVRVDVVMDDVAEADELRDGLRRVASALPNAEVLGDDDVVTRFTSCVQI